MQPVGIPANAYRRVEKLAQARFGEQLFSRPVGDDAAIAHEDDASNFREYIAEVVSDHDQARAFAREAAEGFAKFPLRSQIERVGRLVEKELLRTVDERAGNEDAAFFSGRHCADELLGEVRGFNSLESFARPIAHIGSDVEIRPQGGGGKEAGDYRVEPASDCRSFAGQLCTHGSSGNNAEVAAQLGQIPAFAAKDADEHSRLNDGIELASHGKNKRGFAAAVRTKDSDVLAGANAEIDVVQHHAVTASNIDCPHFQEGLRIDFALAHVQMPGRPSPARLNGLD